MHAPELPCVVQDATEAEPPERTEGSADGPANTHARGGKVADREEQDRSREPRIVQRIEPADAADVYDGGSSQRECLQCDECQNEREDAAKLPERSDQAQQEHETFERKSGREALLREQPGGLVPAWIERDPARAASQHIAARRFAVRQELELQLEPPPELGRYVHADRKVSRGRAHGIFEQRVEKALVPEKIGLYRQARTLEVGERRAVGRERAVGGERNARFARGGDQRQPVLAQLDLTPGGRRGLFQRLVDSCELQVTRPALG